MVEAGSAAAMAAAATEAAREAAATAAVQAAARAAAAWVAAAWAAVAWEAMATVVEAVKQAREVVLVAEVAEVAWPVDTAAGAVVAAWTVTVELVAIQTTRLTRSP